MAEASYPSSYIVLSPQAWGPNREMAENRGESEAFCPLYSLRTPSRKKPAAERNSRGWGSARAHQTTTAQGTPDNHEGKLQWGRQSKGPKKTRRTGEGTFGIRNEVTHVWLFL